LPRKAIVQAVRHGMAVRYRQLSARKVANLISETIEKDDNAVARITRTVLRGILGGNGASQEDLEKFDRLMDDAEEEAEALANTGDEEETEGNSPLPISSVAVAGQS